MIDLGESRFYLLRHSFSLKHKHVEHRRNPLPEMDAVHFQGRSVHLLMHYCIIMFLVRMKNVSSSLWRKNMLMKIEYFTLDRI